MIQTITCVRMRATHVARMQHACGTWAARMHTCVPHACLHACGTHVAACACVPNAFTCVPHAWNGTHVDACNTSARMRHACGRMWTYANGSTQNMQGCHEDTLLRAPRTCADLVGLWGFRISIGTHDAVATSASTGTWVPAMGHACCIRGTHADACARMRPHACCMRAACVPKNVS